MKLLIKACKHDYHDMNLVILVLFAQSYHIWHTWDMLDINGFLPRWLTNLLWKLQCCRKKVFSVKTFRDKISGTLGGGNNKNCQELNHKWMGMQSFLLVKAQELITCVLTQRIKAVKVILPFKPVRRLAAFQFICMTKLFFQLFLSIPA